MTLTVPLLSLALLVPAAAQAPPAILGAELWLDVDGDGQPELLRLVLGREDALFAEREDGSFEEVTQAAGLAGLRSRAALPADVDWDGDLDLVLLGRDGSVRFLRSSGDGCFVDATEEAGLGAIGALRALEWVDLDRDGNLDLAGEREDGSAVFLRNAAGLAFERFDLPLSSTSRKADAPRAPVAEAAPETARGDRGVRDDLSAGLASSSSGATTSVRTTPRTMLSPQPFCFDSIQDQMGISCMTASSVPDLGRLRPLSGDLFVAPNGFVGVGTSAPSAPLSVAGDIGIEGDLQRPPGLDGRNAAGRRTIRLDPQWLLGSTISMYPGLVASGEEPSLQLQSWGTINGQLRLGAFFDDLTLRLSALNGRGLLELESSATSSGRAVMAEGDGENDGGALYVANAANPPERSVELFGDDGLDSGRLQLSNREAANDFTAVDLRALDGNGTGAELLMAANNGAVTIDFDADFDSGPALNVLEEDGSRMMQLQSSLWALFDSSGVATILHNRQTGTKNAVVRTASHGERLLYVMESAEVWFEDFGSAELLGGEARVDLDPIFLETVTIDEERPLFVLVTPSGPARAFVVSTDATGFAVRAAGGEARFDWRAIAHRRGVEDLRLERFDELALVAGGEPSAPRRAEPGAGDGEAP